MTPARPSHCPFCGERVVEMSRYESHAAPDEREEPPRFAVSAEPATPDPETFQTVSCFRFFPCGHLFRVADIEAWAEGEIPPVALGERVENPAGSRSASRESESEDQSDQSDRPDRE